MKNISHLKKLESLDFELFSKYKQVAIFIQSRNDMDTCCCALALAEMIKQNIPNVTVAIYGYIGGSKFIRSDMKPYRNTKVDWEDGVLAVLSEICGMNEISKDNFELLKKAKEILLIDHHEYDSDNKNHSTFIESLSAIPMRVLHGVFFTSACEVLLDSIRISADKWEIPHRAAELIFMGLYTDTSNLKDARTSTFEHIHYLSYRCNVDPSKLSHELNNKSVSHIRLLANVLENGWYSKNEHLIFTTLYTKQVRKYLPHHLSREKSGFKRKQMLTWIPRWIEEYCNAHTIVFTHYSMYEPENPNRRITYVILKKPNPALAHVLKTEGFKQVENRWNREMAHADIITLMEKYQELFTA